MEKRLKKYLEKNRIDYKLHKHTAVFTVQESSENPEIKKIHGLHCKTLFLKDNLGKFYLFAMPAKERLDVKKLEKHLGVKKIKFGSVEELKEKTNLTPGSVSIFGMINVKEDVKLIIDKKVWEAEIVGFHPNINTETLELRKEDLERFYNSLDKEKEIAILGKDN